MWRIRLFEERVGRAQARRRGARADPPERGAGGRRRGVCSQLRDDDAVYSGHRAHGHAIAKGAPLDRVMAELMGRDGGLCRGLGGSMHLVDVEHGFMGATGVVGGNIPIALGSALAARLRGEDSVAVVFFGDGAVQAGHFNETVNLAALWRLPLILVCENNGFAEFTPRSAHTSRRARSATSSRPTASSARRWTETTCVAVWDAFGRYLALGTRGSRAVPARVPDPPPARALRGRSRHVPRGRSPTRSGRRRTRSCGSSATGSRRAGSSAEVALALEVRSRRARSSRRCASARESPFPDRRPDRGHGVRRWLR